MNRAGALRMAWKFLLMWIGWHKGCDVVIQQKYGTEQDLVEFIIDNDL